MHRSYIPHKYFIAAAFFSLLFFILLTILVFNNITVAADQQVINEAVTWESAERNKLMRTISWFGNFQFLVPANLLLIFYFIKKKRKDIALLVFVTAITGLGLKFLLKALFARPRPSNPIVQGIENFSYPSGHALMSVVFYGLLILLTKEIILSATIRKIVAAVSILLILLIGFSRVYLRVHYPTDVLAGYLLGMLWVCLFFFIAKKII